MEHSVDCFIRTLVYLNVGEVRIFLSELVDFWELLWLLEDLRLWLAFKGCPFLIQNDLWFLISRFPFIIFGKTKTMFEVYIDEPR